MDNKLYHHGIKGQKWGKRNGPPYPLSGDSVKAHSGNARSKSDSELAEANRRLRAEVEYNQYIKQLHVPTTKEKVQKFIATTLSTAAKDITTNAVKKIGNQLVDDLVKEMSKKK